MLESANRTSAGYLEVLDRSKKVMQRIPVTTEKLRMGRAYDNDIIVDDPYVCPHHVEFNWADGSIVAEDLGSKNGIRYKKDRRRQKKIDLTDGGNLAVGRVFVRFRGIDFQVDPAMDESFRNSPLRFIESPIFWFLAPLAMIISMMLEPYLSSYDESFSGQVVALVATMIVVLIIWSACWSFASRVVTQRWSFFIHCAIISSGYVAVSLFEVWATYFCYLFGIDGAYTLLVYLINTLLFVFILFFHLRFVSNFSSRRIIRIAASISLMVCFAFLGISHFAREKFSPVPVYNVLIKPITFKFSKSDTPQAFFDKSEKIRERLAEEVEESRKN